MAVVDGGQEGGIDGAEGCSVKILGEFPFGIIVVEDSVAWFGLEIVCDC